MMKVRVWNEDIYSFRTVLSTLKKTIILLENHRKLNLVTRTEKLLKVLAVEVVLGQSTHWIRATM